jgi:LmbE family N-acetylglucosaminyl deacetylase
MMQSADPQDHWSPEDGELLVVAAHPDDEVLGAGGLIHAWAARGAKVTVLSVSDGEGADPSRRDLGTVRRGELQDALRKLCPTHVSVVRLGLPDGKLASCLNRLRNALMSLAHAGVTIIAPYECDARPDHAAVGNVCIEVARSRRIPIARYAVGAWHPPAAGAFRSARWGKFALSDDARRAKARAVQCFQSLAAPACGISLERPYEAFLL